MKTQSASLAMKKINSVLQRNFSVIISDIDGVLTEDEGVVPDSIIRKIVSILNKKVYVSLVSGRSRFVPPEDKANGCLTIEDVFQQIRQCTNLADSDLLQYLIGFEQNGAVIFDGFTDDDPRKNALDLAQPEMDIELQKKLLSEISKSSGDLLSLAEHKSHSLALWLDQRYLQKNNKNTLKVLVDQCLQNFNIHEQYESFQTATTIDIGPKGISKASAVDFYIRAGFSLKQIVRIGDSTFSGGNDQPMVQYQGKGDDGGFSVEHYAELDDSLVTSLPKAINKTGIDATLWLLGQLQFDEEQPNILTLIK